MKRLIIIRHAKSSWEFDVIDHERPLKNRGISDAHLVSKHLKQMNLSVDKILSSDAVRTKLTADIFVKNLGLETLDIEFKYKLYDFEGRDLLETVKNCDNTINTLMIFGHNHAITAFVNTYGDKFIDNVPTSGAVILDFNITNWNRLTKGKTEACIFPRDFKV
ncbi:SixA phosphatase family protein [Seonamhaeicola marinus]|uniref:Histidine phosphatase family protein n=1 Tax=Seonamhaeicola marinus TaxID=1912246 RepID=A0A5D0HL12_9FLAO|nr:histidine phosphatase family protein [Seonamhaeicola marinus]TYA72011.1 histidine phosphatase family protein [Seonamhaeicola marinus]